MKFDEYKVLTDYSDLVNRSLKITFNRQFCFWLLNDNSTENSNLMYI